MEPYPIAVTRSRFPDMRHLGDISKINGAEIEPVDVITFGSPCQDLSVAGKRAGLKHEANGDEETTRSGLFMEAVRIIKEMREATNGIYPRIALWENVPGAFSSNKGEDFRIVLEELIKIVEPAAVMPPVPTKGGWPYADSYTGDGWSLAYRVFDAQYWGVPQRRRRIHLVVDFGGLCARKILFECEGLRGYFEAGRAPWKGFAGNAENCSGTTDCAGKCVAFHLLQDPISSNKISPCIGQGNSKHGQASIGIVQSVIAIDQQGGKGGANYAIDVMPTLCSDSHGTPHAVAYASNMILDDQGGQQISVRTDGKAPTLRAETHGNLPCVLDIRVEPVCYNGENITSPLNKTNPQPGDPCHTLGTDSRNYIVFAQNQREEVRDLNDKAVALNAQPGTHQQTFIAQLKPYYIVRRLTPIECARLQGFPDSWGVPDQKNDLTDEEYQFWLDVRNTHAEINGKAVKDYTKDQMLKWYNKLHTDSAEYKMWGNGIALPPALYCMQGIVDALKAGEAVNENTERN